MENYFSPQHAKGRACFSSLERQDVAELSLGIGGRQYLGLKDHLVHRQWWCLAEQEVPGSGSGGAE